MGNNKYKIIGISGKKGSGKDTFYKLFNKHSPYIYQNAKLTDKLREIASNITGLPLSYFYDRNKYDTHLDIWGMNIRQLLQKLGLEALRENFDYDVWLKTFFANYDKEENYMITDIRFPNEIEAIREHGGIVIRLEGRSEDDGDNHGSEHALNNFNDYDYIIDNSGSIDNYENEILELIDQMFTTQDYLEHKLSLRKDSVTHYTKSKNWIQPIQVFSNMGPHQCNYIKYLSRHESKGQTISDLNKSLDYLFWSIESMEVPISVKNNEKPARAKLFNRFISQHPESTREIIEEFIIFQGMAYKNSDWKSKSDELYSKVNLYALENFGMELTSNMFYYYLKGEIDE